jgi:predicted transcriptional regulator
MTSSLSLDRLILVDLLHNRGSTHRQVSYRIREQSPDVVHRSLSRLVCSGRVTDRAGRLEITRDGLQSLYRQVKV